jgi:FkbM family methyltransferase
MKQSKVIFRNSIKGTFNHRPNPFDELFLREIWTDECYFRGGYDIKPNDTIIDIGGHIGLFSILAAKLGAKKVITFEPVKNSFDILVSNIKENNVESIVQPYNIAITADGREVNINTNFEDPNWNTGSARVLEEGKIGETKAQSKKLDTIFRENNLYEPNVYCDFLKIDCEGAEYEILYGVPGEVFGHTKVISMEFHRSLQDGKMLSNFLEHKGYNVKLSWSYGEVGILQARHI